MEMGECKREAAEECEITRRLSRRDVKKMPRGAYEERNRMLLVSCSWSRRLNVSSLRGVDEYGRARRRVFNVTSCSYQTRKLPGNVGPVVFTRECNGQQNNTQNASCVLHCPQSFPLLLLFFHVRLLSSPAPGLASSTLGLSMLLVLPILGSVPASFSFIFPSCSLSLTGILSSSLCISCLLFSPRLLYHAFQPLGLGQTPTNWPTIFSFFGCFRARSHH